MAKTYSRVAKTYIYRFILNKKDLSADKETFSNINTHTMQLTLRSRALPARRAADTLCL